MVSILVKGDVRKNSGNLVYIRRGPQSVLHEDYTDRRLKWRFEPPLLLKSKSFHNEELSVVEG